MNHTPANPATPPVTGPDRPLEAWLRPAVAAAVSAAVVGGVASSTPQWPWLAALAAGLAAGLAAWRPTPAPAVTARATSDDLPTRLVPVNDGSLRDPETGMFHRAAFLALAERDWLRAGRYGGEVALLIVEIDRLRQMTDRSGPRVADALLAGLGRQVLASLRAADLLARFDDAQLAVFLPHADPTGALDVADRIRDMVEQLRLPGLPDGARFSASVGVAVLRPLHQPLSSLVTMSQQALNLARQAGGNCVRGANPDLAWMPPRDLPTGDNAARPAPGGDA